MCDLAKLSAVDAAKQTRAGAISAAELVEAALERIAALNERLQAFMTIDETGARRTAERLDAIPASQRGPLHGLPIAFKDLVATAGVRTTYGSLVHAHNTPAANELCVARTLEAGGVLIGKTTTPEFGFGATCQNRLAGYPHERQFQRWLGCGGVYRHDRNCPRNGLRRFLPYRNRHRGVSKRPERCSAHRW